MELNEIRLEIDRINREMQTLFEERMKLCGQVAQYKGAHGMEIFVPAREEAILDAVRQRAAPSMARYDDAFFRTLMSLSREYLAALLGIDPQDPHAAAERWETARLTLEPLRREDLPPVYSLTSDPEVARFMRFDAHTDPQQTLELIDELTAQGNHAYLATTRDGGGLVGVFALKKDPDHPGSATLTVFLDKSRWGNGYCGELLAFALEHAPAMGFSQLRAWVVEGNTASQKSLESAGFTVEQKLTFRGWNGCLITYLLNL